MKTYKARKTFRANGYDKAIIQGEFKDLYPGTQVLVHTDDYYRVGTVETRGTGGVTSVRFDK